MATLEKRVKILETRATRRHKYKPPDPEEAARRGKWLGDVIDTTCGRCPERIEDESGVIMHTDLLCGCGKSFLNCQRFRDDLLARADIEGDRAEKDELLPFHAWLSRGKI